MNRKKVVLIIAGVLTIPSVCISPSAALAQGKIQAHPASSSRPIEPTKQTAAPGQKPASDSPAIVATVNGEPITRDELASLCLERYGDQVLDSVLNKYLIMQACQSQNVRVTQKDVDDEIARIAAKFSLSTKLYLKLIEDERDITAEQYSADIIWPMLALRQLARDKVSIDPAVIQQVIDSEYGPKVQVRMIAITNAEKANTVFKQAMANPDLFKDLAKQHSEDPTSASVEGLLPPIRHTTSDDPLEKAAFALKPDQVSQLIKVGEMHVCLQCVRFTDGAVLTAEQTPAIIARVKAELEDQQLRDIAEGMFGNLRSQASVETVFHNASLTAKNPGVAAFINRQPIPMTTLEDEVIKRFGPPVLENEINRRIVNGAVKANKVNVTEQDLYTEVARAADYYGFLKNDGSPDVEAWIAKVLKESNVSREIYLADVVWPTVALKKLTFDKVEVTQQDLQDGYDYDYGPRAEVMAIVCSNQRTAQEVWQMARDKPSDQFFGELAAQYSVEPTSRSNYGKIPPIHAHSGQATLEKAAFKLQPGELSGILEIANQYVILKGQGRTQPVVTDPNAVRDELLKSITESKQRKIMTEYLDRIVASAAIDNFLVPKSQLGAAATKASLQELQIQR